MEKNTFYMKVRQLADYEKDNLLYCAPRFFTTLSDIIIRNDAYNQKIDPKYIMSAMANCLISIAELMHYYGITPDDMDKSLKTKLDIFRKDFYEIEKAEENKWKISLNP